MDWMWPLLKILASIAILSLLIALGLSLLLVWTNTHPPRYPLRVSPASYGEPLEEVSFRAEDGISLKGWHLRPRGRTGGRAPGLILCHGLGASKSDFVELGVYLCRRGFHVLLFDFRAHGDSEGRKCSLGYLERRDLLAALSLLRQREGVDAERVGVYGFSLGGAVAILTAAEHLEIRAVVSDSSFSSMEEEAIHALTRVYHLPKFPFLWLGKTAYQLLFGFGFEKISPMAAIARLSGRPVLLIAGVGDETIPDAHAGYLYEAAGQPKELWLIQGAVHGGTLAAAGPEYQKKVEEFFSQALKMEEEKRDRYPPRSPVLNARRPENWRQRLEGGGQGPEPGGRAPGGGGRYAGRGGHKTGGGGLSGK